MPELITQTACLHQPAGPTSCIYSLVFQGFPFWFFPFHSTYWTSSTMNVLTGPKSIADCLLDICLLRNPQTSKSNTFKTRTTVLPSGHCIP